MTPLLIATHLGAGTAGVVAGVAAARHWVRIVGWLIHLDRWGIAEQREFLESLASKQGRDLVAESDDRYIRALGGKRRAAS